MHIKFAFSFAVLHTKVVRLMLKKDHVCVRTQIFLLLSHTHVCVSEREREKRKREE